MAIHKHRGVLQQYAKWPMISLYCVLIHLTGQQHGTGDTRRQRKVYAECHADDLAVLSQETCCPAFIYSEQCDM